MTTDTAERESVQTLQIRKEIEIAAPLETTWESLLAELGPESQMPGGQPFPMKLEPWPGGRWFRDVGNNAGHFWGHVQVIKPPTLLEIQGPLFMSYPAVSHLQYRLTAAGDGTRLVLVHRAIGLIAREHSEGVNQGWEYRLNRIRELAERKKSK